MPRANTPSTLPVPPPLLVPSRIWPYAGGTLSFGYFGAWPYSSPFWFPGYPPGGAAPDPFDTSGPEGGLRLSVEPKDAEVFVDGYFAGIVDDFDGHFQHLDLAAGPHHVEVRAAGHEPLVVDLIIPAHHTTVYRDRLTPSQP